MIYRQDTIQVHIAICEGNIKERKYWSHIINLGGVKTTDFVLPAKTLQESRHNSIALELDYYTRKLRHYKKLQKQYERLQ